MHQKYIHKIFLQFFSTLAHMKGKNFIIPLIIYPFDIMFSIGESNSKLRKT